MEGWIMFEGFGNVFGMRGVEEERDWNDERGGEG